MKRSLFLSMMMIVFVLPMLLALPAPAQTLTDPTGRPGTYSFSPRAPWYQDQAQITMTHTAAGALGDTLALPGLTTTAKVLLQRRTPTLAIWAGLRSPTITMKADTLFVNWPAADTLTYDLYITRRKRY